MAKTTASLEQSTTFWMSYKEVTTYFKSLNVCRSVDWKEVRIKGKFQRFEDINHNGQFSSLDTVISKWYYKLDIVGDSCRIFIGLHQEDERIYGVQECRPYLDIGIVVLKITP